MVSPDRAHRPENGHGQSRARQDRRHGGEERRSSCPGERRKVAESLVPVAAAAGLIAFAHLGAFDNSNDPFPRSVIAHTG
jgi:hypothetical protein